MTLRPRQLIHLLVTFQFSFLSFVSFAYAQPVPLITEVQVEQEGRSVTDPLILGLIETTRGEPLSMADVRETYAHLTSLNRFDDVQLFQEPAGAGVRLRYVLFPLHPVDRIEFRGMLGLPEDDLRTPLTTRFGDAPSVARMAEVATAIAALYGEHGYFEAMVVPKIEETHNPDRATMAFDIQAGRRWLIGAVDVDEIDATDRAVAPGPIAVRVGTPYDAEAIRGELARYEASLRERGFYEVATSHNIRIETAGTVTVQITVDRGPRVSVAFSGDPLPEDDREDLVPIQTEGSADEDLLEDATFAIEEYLRARGYRDARAMYTRTAQGADLIVTFTVTRGRRYLVDDLTVTGNVSLPTDDVVQLLRLQPGEPFVQQLLDAGAGGIRETYRIRGFTRPLVQPAVTELPGDPGADVRVQVRVNITEGPRTLVGGIAFEGNTVFTEGQLRSLMTTAPNRPYSELELVTDRDRIDIEYRNRGYESVVVTPTAALADNGTRADIRFAITEGPQVLVDHVIIVGNDRTSLATIERELLLRPGEPLGLSAISDSQSRLVALGLFSRVRIEPIAQGSNPRRDVIVQVTEAPANTWDFGGGIEGGTRLRPTGDGGQAEERFEFAPRGSFQIGRRNLWGKNRSINLFTRVTLRSRDVVLSSSGIRLELPGEGGGYGFNEYRALLTYREPRVFNSGADLLVTGILDQAIRSSFNFVTRQVRAELGMRLPRGYSVAGRYSYEHTRLFDERFTDDEKPLIDRLFPQVRLSKFSGSFVRDSRNDILDPDRGTFVIVDNEVAARAIGSEVGFVKTFVQGFGFYRLPTGRRAILAMGARLGLAQGFKRLVARPGPDGQPVLGADGNPIMDVLQDLPASERFFAGGDTTVRGFSLDRLGTDETISQTGFPLGGNALIVLNSEVRVALFGDFGAVGFLDAGNVFQRAGDVDFGRLRPTAGVGLRYQSPAGPIRIDLGFKLDRRELSPGRLERGYVLHISLGQAF